MPLRPDMTPRDILEVVLRRKWLVIFTFLFVLLGVSAYCVITPEQYRSSTTILIIPQRIPENYVRSTVTLRLEERLATIQQQVMSRTRLMAIMDELGLFREMRGQVPAETIVGMMRRRIEVQVRGNDSFTLSFVHENPQLAMLAASRIASLFIDENLKTREQQAVSTSEFLDSQLQETKNKLEAAEERVKGFKLRYMGELPQETMTNVATLSRLQEQLRSNSDALRTAGDRRVLYESQVAALERMTTSVVSISRDNGVTMVGDPEQSMVNDLAARRARLEELSARYTPRYPEVARLRNEVEQLEKKIIDFRRSTPSDNGVRRYAPSMPTSTTASIDVRELARLRAQLTATESEIASLKKEQQAIRSGIEAIQGRVDRAPKHEQEMVALTRDYENIKRSYDDLMRNKLQADIAQNLEKRQKGEQFQILDPANLPEAPFKPERVKILLMGLAGAIAVGFGGAFALEVIDPTLRSKKEFRQYFQLPVLATIPTIRNRENARRLDVRRAAVLGGMVGFMAALSVFLLKYGGRVRALLGF